MTDKLTKGDMAELKNLFKTRPGEELMADVKPGELTAQTAVDPYTGELLSEVVALVDVKGKTRVLMTKADYDALEASEEEP